MSVLSINLDGLAGGAVAVSDTLLNSSQSPSIQLILKVKPAIIRSGGYLIIGIKGSIDGTNFADFSANELKITSDDGHLKSSTTATFYVNLAVPSYFKIYVHNRTGSRLSSTSGDNGLSFGGDFSILLPPG